MMHKLSKIVPVTGKHIRELENSDDFLEKLFVFLESNGWLYTNFTSDHGNWELADGGDLLANISLKFLIVGDQEFLEEITLSVAKENKIESSLVTEICRSILDPYGLHLVTEEGLKF
jgi:hypothetical protein